MEQQQNLSDDSAADPAQSPGHSKNTVNEEDQKVSYPLDMQVYLSSVLCLYDFLESKLFTIGIFSRLILRIQSFK